MNPKQKGRGLFYTRDSGGKHEMTPAQYVEWAQGKAKQLDLLFDGTPEAIEAMIREERSVSGDLFLDYGVCGNVLSRDGLNALIQEAISDPRVTHILIPRRDRLARPDDPIDGVKLESLFRQSGKTLVFMQRIVPPLPKGKRQDIGELITTILDYDRSGQDRRDLAQKILYAQIRLARLGYSTGGRPPYGFRRWLVKEDGTQVRELVEGERVRMPGHHVVWLPTAERDLRIVQRVLQMLEKMPASRVAATLTAEGTPSPDAGRFRKDNGVKHPVSGVWHQSTVINIARNPLLLAVMSYGRRSMGDQLRFSPSGPRELTEEDYRTDRQSQQAKAKVIRNGPSDRIEASAQFNPIVDPEQQRKLVAILDTRAGTQRGKPRSHDPSKNPLGCRVFDMNCSWPMYREPYLGSFRYKCGLYQQSHGAKCAHNHVDGPTATRFLLSCLRQRMLSPRLLPKLKQRLRELAAEEPSEAQPKHQLQVKRTALAEVKEQLQTVSRNLALAKTQQQYEAVSKVFEELTGQQTSLGKEVEDLERRCAGTTDRESEIRAAIELAHQLTELVGESDNFEAAAEVFQLVNARLFLSFRGVQVKKRTVNRVTGGVATFGANPPPIEIYQGPTARRQIKGPAASDAAGPGGRCSPTPPERSIDSGREGKSLGNVNRGDWI